MVNMFGNWTIDNFLSLISIILIIVGGFFALKKWNLELKTKRAEFLEQINLNIRSDDKLAEITYLIEYDFSWYNENFHGNKTGLEFSVDRFLAYFDYICYLKKLGNFTKKEMMIFQYRIIRIFNSPCVRNYLWNIYHFSKKSKTCCSFTNLINYGIKNRLIDKFEFEDSNNGQYIKYLNF